MNKERLARVWLPKMDNNLIQYGIFNRFSVSVQSQDQITVEREAFPNHTGSFIKWNSYRMFWLSIQNINHQQYAILKPSLVRLVYYSHPCPHDHRYICFTVSKDRVINIRTINEYTLRYLLTVDMSTVFIVPRCMEISAVVHGESSIKGITIKMSLLSWLFL